jgi:alkylation response protein AidB-like acyl-CoA dehydrogenase
VDFELSDEQRLFRQTLREFADKEIMPVAPEWERTGRYPAEIVSRLRELGLFGLNVPGEYGGLAADRVSYALAFEEIARAWLGAAGLIGPHSVACWLVARNGTPEQKQRYLPAMASGELRSGIALTEPGAGTDLQGIATRAVRDGGGGGGGGYYTVTGAKTWITNARVAGLLPVLVKTGGAQRSPRAMSVLLVETSAPGFTVTRDLPKLGYKGPETCELVLDQVRVPAGSLLGGEEGRGLQQVLSALEIGRINIAARAVGVAQAAYDAALGYARTREAFGHPIAEFQAIQLKLADMATEIQAARLLTYWAAARSEALKGDGEAGGGRVDLEAGMAKMYASEVALKCALESMRIHGGYGYSAEFVVERLYRDAPLMAIGEGTNDVQRLVIARSLVSGAGRLGW